MNLNGTYIDQSSHTRIDSNTALVEHGIEKIHSFDFQSRKIWATEKTSYEEAPVKCFISRKIQTLLITDQTFIYVHNYLINTNE